MSETISLPGHLFTEVAAITSTLGTKGQIILDVLPPQVLPDISGFRPLQGESSQPQVELRGGCGITDALISSTSGSNQSIIVYIGRESSEYADMGIVTTVATTGQIIVNRNSGSFLTDKLSVSSSVMLFGTLTAANEGLPGQVTGVTATAVTINMPGVTVVNETQASGFRIVELGHQDFISVSANAGNYSSVKPVNMFTYLGNVRKEPVVTLGPKNVLIARMSTAIAALPDTVGISISGKLH